MAADQGLHLCVVGESLGSGGGEEVGGVILLAQFIYIKGSKESC